VTSVPARHLGDPAAEYAAATRAPGEEGAAPGGAALFDRSDRVRILLRGKGPGRMLAGVATGTVPPDPEEVGPGEWARTSAPESLVLTPKGRIVSDLRLLRIGAGEEGDFLLELPAAGRAPLQAHFTRYLPPRFARPVDLSGETRLLTVAGPNAPGALAEALAGALAATHSDAPGAAELAALSEGGAFLRGTPGGGDLVAVIRSAQVLPPALDVLGSPAALAPVEAALLDGGVRKAGAGAWHTLRIERGTPETGAELGEDVLPPEAGLERRAIDHTKGCYTGQEVVVRIRDRGHVNRHLRGVLLGDLPAPAPGTPLFDGGRERRLGEVRSAASSPRFGQTIALGYVRREVGPGGRVRLGAPDGPEVEIRGLAASGWEDPVESDPSGGYS
jgi:tRNA-modifying protein YgfZ